jgi:pimeloyl-ACP methyl ester carboxylesterase
MRAAVILPEDHGARSGQRYPTLYWIGGFGSDHRIATRMMSIWDAAGQSDSIARVVLDPLCYGGHHVFADSPSNGPRGRALVEELIPHLERRYPLDAAPEARFLAGHSSGGWASLWLQVTFPDAFGGTWSSSPDPVDFRDFQRVDLYAPGANVYVDEAGRRRPIARAGERIIGWFDSFAAMEVVLGEGGQLRSFEWAFSPRGVDGTPLPLFDRETGAVRADVAESWQRYDIRLVLERSWPTVGPRLAGKLHVLVGDQDNFYLDGAVALLRQALEDLGSDAQIEILPGHDHSSMLTTGHWKRMDEQILETYAKWKGTDASSAPDGEAPAPP